MPELTLWPCREIEDCIQQLMLMDKNWNNAEHCAGALENLLETLQKQYNENSKGKPPIPLSSDTLTNPTQTSTAAGDPSRNTGPVGVRN